MNYITAFSRISNQVLSVNGKQVFSSGSAVADFATEAYTALQINYPKFYKMDTLSKIGCIAAEPIMNDDAARQHPYRSAVILSNAGASLEADARYQEASAKAPSPALFVYTLPNIVAGELCIRYGIKGESNFFVHEVYRPDFLSSYIDCLFSHDITICLAGWLEIMHHKADVLLYRVEKEKRGLALNHTPETLNELYAK